MQMVLPGLISGEYMQTKRFVSLLCFLPAFFLLQLFASCSAEDEKSVKAETISSLSRGKQSEQSWTVLVYMAADNNLESAAIKDFNELEDSVFADYANSNVLVLFDRNESFDQTNGNWSDTRLFCVKKDTNSLSKNIVSQRLDCPRLGLSADEETELDMADKDNLCGFLEFAAQKYPASHYALIVWGHGTGWRSENASLQKENRAFAIDCGSSSTNYMTLSDMRSAIEDSAVHLDVLAFDTCYGGIIESFYEFKDCADYIIASQSAVSGDGWNYTAFLDSVAASDCSAKTFCDSAVEQFKEQYKDFAMNGIAAVKTCAIEELYAAFDSFFDAARLKIDCHEAAVLALERIFSQALIFRGGSFPCDSYVDIFSIASVLSKEFSLEQELNALKTAIENSIEKSFSSETACGIGVNFCVESAPSVPCSNGLHSQAYIHESGAASQSLFVRKNTSYVPSKSGEDSFLDRIFYKNFFAQ